MQKSISLMLIWGLMVLLSACSDEESVPVDNHLKEQPKLTVYKTESCGCCGEWVNHVQGSGFRLEVVNQDSVAHVKDYYHVPKNARSCHTAVSENGKVFEGHVPAKWIHKYLSEERASKGLLVPAMPVGSPGMEYQDQFNPYTIYELMSDGSMKKYVDVATYSSQF